MAEAITYSASLAKYAEQLVLPDVSQLANELDHLGISGNMPTEARWMNEFAAPLDAVTLVSISFAMQVVGAASKRAADGIVDKAVEAVKRWRSRQIEAGHKTEVYLRFEGKVIFDSRRERPWER